jgi:hypothetical protein
MEWDTPDFTFEGRSFEAKVLSVYDGDMVKVAFPFGGTEDNQPKGKGIWIQGEGSSP